MLHQVLLKAPKYFGEGPIENRGRHGVRTGHPDPELVGVVMDRPQATGLPFPKLQNGEDHHHGEQAPEQAAVEPEFLVHSVEDAAKPHLGLIGVVPSISQFFPKMFEFLFVDLSHSRG